MTRLFIVCAGIVSFLLLSFSPVSADDKESIMKLVDSGVNALNAKDMAAFEKLHVTDENVVHIGPGEGELHVGWTASKQGFEQFLQMNPKLANLKNLALNVDGNSAWGVWTFDTQMDIEGKPMLTPNRLTLVFKGSGGKWLVSHSHASVALPPPPGEMKK